MGQGRTITQDNGKTYVTGSSATGGLAGATNTIAAPPNVRGVSVGLWGCEWAVATRVCYGFALGISW